MKENKVRQIAAVMFTDIVGYTAMMQTDEDIAAKVRRRHREVFEQQHTSHLGEIIQYYGDGTLSVFKSAVSGVECAIKIQTLLQEEPIVPLRVGLHLGDIVFDKTEVYGDAVNFASRIESMGVPGAILISGKLNDELKNHAPISTVSLGHFEMKNITLPVEVFAVNNKGIVVPQPSELKGKQKIGNKTIAVLPFVNMSTDPENEYFSDGITEELLNVLTKVKGLQVTSRTSAFAFKGKNTDIREIGVQLNVGRVLEGSVRKSGNRVRISAQLINAADGYHIWSETYDRNLTDIFEVQDEISSIIANKLRENLNAEQHEEKLVKVPTQNIEAYTLFLKGLHFYNKVTPGDTKKAIEYFEKAITLEAGYAHAYAMAAAGYAFLGATGQMQPKEAFEIVHRNSDKALQLD
ncbi:MAG TPA: adenylate/guanylate cyclase domain-containing protein, partial [Segetibacter sp.]